MIVKVNNTHEFEMHDAQELDIVKRSDGTYNLIHQNKSYSISLGNTANRKEFEVFIDGRSYQLNISDQYDLLVDKLGFSQANAQIFNDIKAPMPGLVLEIMVKEGDTIQEGDALLILEAMKMENIIKAPGDGQIKSINVKPGDAIEKNIVLIEME